MEKVLRNCKPFVEVLAMAHGPKVQHWTAEHFQRATTWCVYFEKAYSMMIRLPARSSSVHKQLHSEVTALQEPWPSSVQLDFAYLEHCLSHMCSVLLKNQFAPSPLLAMAARAGFSSKDFVFWAKEVFDLFKSDNLAERLQPVILEVLPSLDVSQHTSGVVIHQDSTAALTALACQLCNCLIAGDKEQFTGLSPEQERLLYEVVKLDAGLDIMLTVCATHSTRVQSGLSTQADDDHQCVIPSRLASELIDWLLSCNVPSTALDTSTRPPPAATLSPCAHSHTLFFSDPSLLSSCAIRFDTLLDCYVQHLLHWTESFVRVELCDCSLSDMQPGSYHWHHAQVLSSTASANHSDDDKLTLSLCACPPSLKHWQTLVTCFKSLAHQYGPVRQQILEQLQRKSQWTQQEHGTVSPPMQCLLWKADFQNNIWEDMLSNVTLV